MTPDDVIFFCNHKYGEKAYYLEDINKIFIYTAKSIWQIFKEDYNRFGQYSLKHLNYSKNDGTFHNQSQSKDLNFLVYYAFMHDYNEQPYGKQEYENFKYLYDMYLYGKELFESCSIFNFLSL